MHPLLELNVHYYFFLFHRRPVGNHRACTYVPHAVLQVHYHPFSDVNIFAFSCSILKQIKDGVSMFSTTILHVWGQSENYFLISDGALAIFCLISVFCWPSVYQTLSVYYNENKRDADYQILWSFICFAADFFHYSVVTVSIIFPRRLIMEPNWKTVTRQYSYHSYVRKQP